MDEIDLVESLKIEQVVNKYKCPTRVETCSAITTRKEKPDKPIADGFRFDALSDKIWNAEMGDKF